MATINIHEAKTHFSSLLKKVRAGKELVIAKAGKPVAKLVSVKSAVVIRKPGLLKGKIKIASDFDAPLPGTLRRAFEGRK